MQKRHLNRQQYFDELALSSRKYFLPYIENFIQIDNSTRVLEIGCGDGGNLLPFAERGCMVMGIDLSESRILQARKFFAQSGYTAQFKTCNIFDMNVGEAGKYDLILVHDVIEHIYEKKEFMRHIKPFFRPNGVLFIGFPAWQMPFGGHQQICRNKIISFLPFLHLLPNPLYRGIAKIGGESQKCMDELMDIKRCRTTIEMFENLVCETGYLIESRKLWFINPHYETKFHLRPCSLSPFIAQIPYIRNFLSTSCFFILKNI
ncbi:tRNA 5-carboxymethoxyuridine methyltransferase [termite gut metagenome]|uniref:tRNA 5-carboxymethoxyuridine methyltransferase n=1 Tax=termite gut metagenome TaxID=433724 RepID=A0A5J4S6J9_9ZZZZ